MTLSKIGDQNGIIAAHDALIRNIPEHKPAWDKLAATQTILVHNNNELIDKLVALPFPFRVVL